LIRRYGDLVAVDDVSFDIDRGEVVGLLGHNGAGKTTIMKMISGYLEPSAGRIEIGGMDIARHRTEVQKRLGYLPEILPIYPEMSVADYLDYAAKLKGLPAETVSDEIRRVVDATEIRPRLLAPIATLSRGYKQRLGVAQAILGNPRLLILDEPTNGLDPAGIVEIRDLLVGLGRQGRTVVVSSHLLAEIQAACDRLVIIQRGRLVFEGPIHELLAHTTDAVRLEPEHPGERDHLAQILTAADVRSSPDGEGLVVDGSHEPASLNRLAADAGIVLKELHREREDLEDVFLRLTASAA
jgi:ABC-2 type transport system ATP-binding protein